MTERLILVCDVCGKPAAETVTIKAGRRNFVKDLCESHITELTRGARRPRPGRRRGTVAASSAAKTARSTRTTKKSTGKRRGRPPKNPS